MKRKGIVKIFMIAIILILSTLTISYARYVLIDKKDISMFIPPSDAGSLDFFIANEENTYNVSQSEETTVISSTVTLENKYNISKKSYYAWTTTNTEPKDEDYTEFEFVDNKYTVKNEGAKIGTYYLWVKVTYTSEIGEEKAVIKTSRMISVVLGDIKITLSDDSEYLTGDITATINYVGAYTNNAKAGYGKSQEEAIANATTETANSITIAKEEIDTIYYIYAVAEDESGNQISTTVQVDNIDNIKPTIVAAIPSFARVKINLTDNKSGVKYYTLTTTNTEPSEYTNTLTTATTNLETYIDNLEPNTTYYLWVKDGVGNVISQEFTTLNLTYTSTPELTEWTNGNVIIRFCDLAECTLTYSLGGTNTYTYNSLNGIEVSENATVSYTLQDGNNSITEEIIIDKIDKVAPTINVSSDYDKVTITGTDSGSGIIGYLVTDTEIADITIANFTSVTATSNLNVNVTEDYLGNNLEYNRQYYVYIKDIVGNVSRGDVIAKIDTELPEINITGSSCTTNSISISALATDAKSGFTGTYKYYISTESGVYNSEPVEKLDIRHTFEGLEHNLTYYIKVEVKDVAGRVNSIEQAITTNELLVNNDNNEITFANATWSSNIQTVTIKTTTEYEMKYQIVKDGGTIELANSYWSEAVSSGTQITGLENGDLLLVRLYDGTNNSTNYATYNIINQMQSNYPTLTETQMQNIAIGTFSILTYSANTENISVATSNNNSNTLTYNYYMKNVKTNEYNLVMTSSKYNEQVTIEQPQEYQIYSTICVELSNNTSGTLTRSKNKAITIATEPIESGAIADENRTYIDSNYYTAIVPKGFAVSSDSSENIIANGLVLKDDNNNEFVWIPVQNAIYNETTTSLKTSNNYIPLARHQRESTSFFEKIYYSYSGTTGTGNVSSTSYRIGGSSYREPSLITGNSGDKYTWNVTKPVGTTLDTVSRYYKDILGFESSSQFGEYLNSEYTNIITSVDRYGGYLVGRYETTVDSSGVVGSKANETVLNNKNWYELYKAQNSSLNKNNKFYNSNVVVSNMITGSQYDGMLNFILYGNDTALVTEKSTNYGNKTNSIAPSGLYANDKMSNIYDLIANAYETTTEAYSSTSRVARGSTYLATVTNKSASDRMTINPTENGATIGSRMALYLLDSSDKTPPTFTVTTTRGTNNIKVDVNATDSDNGIGNYYYSISNDGITYSDEVETIDSSYTFTGLKQGRTYHIRIKVVDSVGNATEYYEYTASTNSLNVSDGDLFLRSVYGKNGSMVAILGISSTLKEAGYYSVYYVLENENALNTLNEADIIWTQGDAITNLSDTNIILAKLADSSGNEQADYSTFYLEGLSEEFSTIYDETTPYKNESGETVAYIPAGFAVGISNEISSVEKGLVITDAVDSNGNSTGNEYVWVPVKNAIYNGSTTIDSSYTPMVMMQTGKNSKYYEGICYEISAKGDLSANTSYKIGTLYYREPSLASVNVNGSSIYTWDIENIKIVTPNRDTQDVYYNINSSNKSGARYNSAEEFGKYMNEEYYNMINSIEKYGGFYIARYETSVYSGSNLIVQSQSNKTPYRSVLWYNMNYYQDSNRCSINPYYNSNSVVSSMMWNSQYSAMLNWIYNGKYKDLLTDTEIGYHTKVANTGKTTKDIINNIFDLAGNMSECTLGAYSSYTKILRGGNYYSNSSAIFKHYIDTAGAGGQYGTRMALYIVDGKDDIQPIVTKRDSGNKDEYGNTIYVEPEITSNSIKVKVNAYDPDNSNGTTGSGIKKYVYSISGTTNGEGEFINYEEHINFGNTFTFESLKQHHTYNIKVTVYDHTGKSTTIDLGSYITNTITIEEPPAGEDARYGIDGSGTIYIDFNDTNQEISKYHNYYLEYQVGKGGADCIEDGNWNKTTLINPQTGVQVDGLSVGDIVYARVTDGTQVLDIPKTEIDENGNEVTYTFPYIAINIDKLETYGTPVATKTEVTDRDGDKTVVIPTGFAASELYNDVDTGFVIKRILADDGTEITDGDEFVWIPVNKSDVIYDINRSDELANSSSSTNTYKPMAREQTNTETTSNTTDEQINYEGIQYNYHPSYKTGSYVMSKGNRLGVTTSYREPGLVTGHSKALGWINAGYGNAYDMLESNYKTKLGFNSVDQFGQYMNNEYKNLVNSVVKYGGFWVGRYETSIIDGKARSIKGQTPMAYDWYQMYLVQESGINTNNPYYNNSDVASNMIFGSQWDAMLNWIITGKDKAKVYNVIGNHEGRLKPTGQFGNDYINSIFDLGSNVMEWTQEGYSSTYRAYRGGNYRVNFNVVATTRNDFTPTNSFSSIGSRFTLYVK